jgi:hypothetical protein
MKFAKRVAIFCLSLCESLFEIVFDTFSHFSSLAVLIIWSFSMATACNGHTVVNGTTKQPVVDVERVGRLLRDSSQPMKARFRALFILR